MSYRDCVRNEYYRKRKANQLSVKMIELKRSGIREECLALLEQRCENGDENILWAIFGPADKGSSLKEMIYKYDIDRFRPLVKFLRENTGIRDLEDIDFLAWLIDFQPRPYKIDVDYLALDRKRESEVMAAQEENVNARGRDNIPKGLPVAIIEPVEEPDLPEGGGISAGEAPVRPGKDSTGEGVKVGVTLTSKLENQEEGIGKDFFTESKARFRRLTAWFYASKAIRPAMLMIIASMIAYFLSIDEPREQSCMYWKDDHFQSAPCYLNIPGASLIALDAQKANNFRKITDWRTITPKDIGVVFYGKSVDTGVNIELFTCYGIHPVNPNIKLKPVTKYIYGRYIEPKIKLLQDSSKSLTLNQ
ncbi:hypothetical protein [Filimonas effusa]|uniref:Uncharacterized protein n=1 Tax=Filimonas effusa TaxID=2508721 RepID=A0A4Q1D928_9BACT|nr:hypothetical protein [Filimonas effusa]RXK85720.1 hypothetical protein ESB13_02575 [Filimonas effusa]